MQVYFDDLVVDGERIAYHWTFTGTNTGPGGTGNAVRMKRFESWTLDADGLIAASLGTYDAEEYARQMAEGVEEDSCQLWEVPLLTCGRSTIGAANRVVREL